MREGRGAEGEGGEGGEGSGGGGRRGRGAEEGGKGGEGRGGGGEEAAEMTIVQSEEQKYPLQGSNFRHNFRPKRYRNT